MDENGYIHISMQEVSSILSVSLEEAEDALSVIQSLEPAGIGARNLQECLLLQIVTDSERNQLASTIVSDYFSLFAEKKWKKIAKELTVELSQIQEVYDYIQTLNPRPGADFQSEQTSYIVPDILIKWEGPELTVSMFDDSLPKIHFNNQYYRKFQSNGDEKVKRFLQEKQQDFGWIMKSIEQRKETIMKVTLKIVEKQPDYFISGPEYIKTNDHEGNIRRTWNP